MTAPLLIDTCGWIDFLRGRAGALTDRVERAIADDSARLCSVSVAELLQGIKGARERQQLALLFAHVGQLPVTEPDWFAAGLALQALRSQGVTVPLTDALIAAVARRNRLPVLTVDEHFRHLSVDLA
jgi:predicted nucleic acid-binding protein